MMMASERFAERIQRAGADVAEHDTDRTHDEFQRGLLTRVPVLFGRFVAGVVDAARHVISHEGNARWSYSYDTQA